MHANKNDKEDPCVAKNTNIKSGESCHCELFDELRINSTKQSRNLIVSKLDCHGTPTKVVAPRNDKVRFVIANAVKQSSVNRIILAFHINLTN